MEGPALPKMSKALANAIEDENRRVAVDSAKKKAVSQFADYDTFKNMVSVAHLKPINQPGAKGNGAYVFFLSPPAVCLGSHHAYTNNN